MELKSNSLTCSPRGILVVIGGILIHLSLGTYFTFGNFAPYIISYVRNRTDDTGLRNVDAIWVPSIGAVANCLGMTIGGILTKRFGPRLATAVGCSIFSASVAMTFFSIKKSFVLVVLTYGVTSIFGNHMAYGPPVQTSMKWFPSHPSLATGFIVAGYGGGALIFNQVITNYINPDNLTPDLRTDDGDRYFIDADLLDRVPFCFLILAASYAGLQLIGIILITSPPLNNLAITQEMNAKYDGIENKTYDGPKIDHFNAVSVTATYKTESNGDIIGLKENQQLQVQKHETIEMKAFKEEANSEQCSRPLKTDPTTKEAIIKMFKTRSFYILFVGVLLGDSGLQFVLGLYKAYGQTFISDDRFLALVGSFASVFNCIGRPLWGIFMDRFRYKISMGIIVTALSVFVATLFTTEYTGKPGFFIWVCLVFLAFSGIPAILPPTFAKLFGTSNMAVNYGFLQIALIEIVLANSADPGEMSHSAVFVFLMLSCGSTLVVSVGGIIGGVLAVTLRAAIGFRGLFFLGAGLNALPLVLLFLFNGKDQDGNPI